MIKNKCVLVTVGTYSFDELIEEIDQEEVYKIFSKFGFSNIIISIGKT